MRLWAQSLGSLNGLRSGIAMSCSVGCRHGSHLVPLWLWLWLWPAAVAPIPPLSWELPHAAGMALKRKKKKKKREIFRKMPYPYSLLSLRPSINRTSLCSCYLFFKFFNFIFNCGCKYITLN